MRIRRIVLMFMSLVLSLSLLMQCQDQRNRSPQQSLQNQGGLIEQMTTITPMIAVYLLESGQYDMLQQKLEMRNNNRPSIRHALRRSIVDDSLLLRYVNQAAIREYPGEATAQQSIPVQDMAYVNMYLSNIARVPSIMTQAVHKYYQIVHVVNIAGENIQKIQAYERQQNENLSRDKIQALQRGQEHAWELIREYRNYAITVYPVVQEMVSNYTATRRIDRNSYPHDNVSVPQVKQVWERRKINELGPEVRFLVREVGISVFE